MIIASSPLFGVSVKYRIVLRKMGGKQPPSFVVHKQIFENNTHTFSDGNYSNEFQVAYKRFIERCNLIEDEIAPWEETVNIYEKKNNALAVIALTPHIKEYLELYDDKALQQVQCAIDGNIRDMLRGTPQALREV